VGILASYRLPHFVAGGQHSYQLAAQKGGVRRNGAKDKCVHHVVQVSAAHLTIPSYPCIARSQVEHGIAQTEQSHQFSVVFVYHQESNAPPVPGRNGDAPVQSGVTKKQFIFRARLDLYQPRLNQFGHNRPARGQPFKQAWLLPNELRSATFNSVLNRLSVQFPEPLLVKIPRRKDAGMAKSKPLVSQGVHDQLPNLLAIHSRLGLRSRKGKSGLRALAGIAYYTSRILRIQLPQAKQKGKGLPSGQQGEQAG
jgi:hypothetical protein